MTAVQHLSEFHLSTRIPSGAVGRTVARARLHSALTEALTNPTHPHPVALVCAPAGSGKTRFVSDWAREILSGDAPVGVEPTIAWLTIDERHNCLGPLHHAVARALIETGNPRLQRACAALDPEAADFGSLLSAAVHDLGEHIWIVVDDAHLLLDAAVLADLESFLRWQPPTFRTIICARFEPPLALQRLRLDGKLFSITSRELAFTSEEAAALLAEHDVHLGTEDLGALMNRTEGWAAGIRLAGMSLEDHPDPSRLIAEFTGNRRTVADYLIEEVLSDQDDDMREFLLRTSVPTSFTVELAEKLTGRVDAHDKVAWLERHNFLISRVAENPTRYRYHPLLRSYLRAEISRIGRVEVEELELTVARWHSEFGDALLALEHAVNAGNSDEIVALLGEKSLSLIIGGHGEAVDRLLARAPRRVVEHPFAGLIRAAAALTAGNLPVAASALEFLDRRRSQGFTESAIDTRLHLLIGEALRVQTAMRTGDIDQALERLRQLDVGSTGDSEIDAFVLLQEGEALLFLGRTEEAGDMLGRALAHARSGQDALTMMHSAGSLAAISMSRGDVAQAAALVDEALALSRDHGVTDDALVSLVKIVGAWCRYVRLDRGAAGVAAEAASAVRLSDPEIAGLADGVAALFELDAAEQRHTAVAVLHAHSPVSSGRPVPPGIRAALLPAIGHVYLSAGEFAWARELATEAHLILGTVGETALLEAMLHLHGRRLDLARRTLQPVLDGNLECAAATNLIAAWLVEAEISLARQQDSRAHHALSEALRLAEPESILRPFHDCAPRVRELLVRSTGRFGPREKFTDTLRASFPRSPTATFETLTPRELELVVELPSWRTAEQIAADLCVSVNTVKTHLRGIYRKLGVASRREAIAAAQQVGLL
ncbi:MAG: LuxR C-terminal-related transcriptional regulator [Rhodococcus sp. (in: high G+C Gram-positive bacteria)]|uniref:LuxR C-terminal-related transcriptional regulator n=1 Tax=Rhodococcus sp. TaxID=1831 RepID=UPI003BAF54F7